MAYINRCKKCGEDKVLDMTCGGYCCECLDKFPELGGHRPNCQTYQEREKEKAQHIINLHEMLEEQIAIVRQANRECFTLRLALRKIDPCPECGGTAQNGCHSCLGDGFNDITDELIKIADAPDPQSRY